MSEFKDKIIQQIREDAVGKSGELSKEFVNARSENKEKILAALEFEKELAGMCDECLNR